MLNLFLGHFPFARARGLESELEIGIKVFEDVGIFGLVMGIGKVDVGCWPLKD